MMANKQADDQSLAAAASAYTWRTNGRALLVAWRRPLKYGITLFLAICLNFFLPRLMPGDPLALVAGNAFGDSNCIRFSYACSKKELKEAVARIKAALEKLS